MRRMSFRYETHAALYGGQSSVFAKEANLNKLVESYPVKKFESSISYSYPSLVGGLMRDCREFVMDDVANYFNHLGKSSRLQTIYIRISADTTGAHFYGKQLKMLEEFAELFFHPNQKTPFAFHLEDGYGILALDVLDRRNERFFDMAAASLFLWIINRNYEMLDWCIKYGKSRQKTPTLKQLFLEISSGFLRNYDWGNSSNENVTLSLFCYAYGTGSAVINAQYDSDGPKEYAEKNIPIGTISKWVRGVVLPYMTENKIKFSRSIDNMLPVHDSLSEDIRQATMAFIAYEMMKT